MDFLDPRKRRSHRIRLMVGYGLMTVAIGLATTILVYGAYGYGIDTKTGNIVQNGLLFMDSKPGNAGIYLNGKYQHRDTAARLVLPAKPYTLTLKKAGYRDWQRKFVLQEHTISRFSYPFLFPDKPVAASLRTYPSMPGLISSSTDRRWLVVQVPASNANPVSFDEFDTSDLGRPSRLISLPRTLLTGGIGGKLTEVEWSDDNNFLLLKNDHLGGSEFVLLDRREPTKSLNLNRLFQTAPTQVALHNKKTDRIYLYDQAAKTLRRGEIGNGRLEPILINQVLAFKAYGSNLVSYVTDSGSQASQTAVHIWDNGKSYPLTTLSVGEKYLIDAAQFQGHWYYVAGSNTSDRISIYKDPLTDLKSQLSVAVAPMATLRISDATEIKFSSNSRFVGLQAGQKFAVYDFEENERYQYSQPSVLAGPMRWMDGHRFIGAAEGSVVVVDYDSTNHQVLTQTTYPTGGYFSENYEHLLTLVPIAGSAAVSLSSIDMRAGVDLPKTL